MVDERMLFFTKESQLIRAEVMIELEKITTSKILMKFFYTLAMIINV